jgi:Transposase domain (DUF772)
MLAVCLYATMEGIGAARAIDRLCRPHAAYRWLCGGAPINHDLLASFRRENGARLDRLLTQSVTGLIAAKLITLEELAIKPAPACTQAGGAKVRARAGRGSPSTSQRLESIAAAVAERVTELKAELDNDPGEPARRRNRRALQAAEQRARRKLTERAHAIIKNRGMFRFLVHGRERVRAARVLQALALNLSWTTTLRRRITAGAAPAPPAGK